MGIIKGRLVNFSLAGVVVDVL